MNFGQELFSKILNENYLTVSSNKCVILDGKDLPSLKNSVRVPPVLIGAKICGKLFATLPYCCYVQSHFTSKRIRVIPVVAKYDKRKTKIANSASHSLGISCIEDSNKHSATHKWEVGRYASYIS